MKTGLLVLLLTFAAAVLSGCSPQERSGVSPLPQNRPSDWEVRPYGDFRS